MAITRIKNNQITDNTIDVSTKAVDLSVTAGKLESNLVYSSDMTITGNLTVNGTTTTINTTNTTVEDPLMVLGSLQAGSGALDIGIIGERGTDTNVAFVWDESADEFVAAYTTTSDSSTTIVIDAYANIHAGSITAEGTVSMADLNLSGNLSVAGTSAFTGDMTAGNIDSATLDTTGNVTIGGTLGVTGATSLSTLTTSGNAILNTAEVSGALLVGSTITATGNISGADLAVDDINATTITTTGAASVGTTLAVTGTSTLTGALAANGGTTTTTLTASGLTDLNGNLDVLGTSNFTGLVTAIDVDTTTMDVAGAATVGTTLDVTGNVTMEQNLTLNGGVGEVFTITDGNVTTTYSIDSNTGNTSIAGTVGITGAVTMANTLDVTGTTTLGTLDAQTSTLNSLTVTTNETVGGTLDVTGVTTLAALLNADGGISVDGNFTVADVTGNVATSGTLDVTGASNFTGVMTAVNIDSATLDTTGNVTIGGSLTTTGTADFNNSVTMTSLTIDPASILDAGGNAWSNLADPLNAQDAVTKAYVDNISSTGWTISDGDTLQVIQGGDTLTIAGTANEVDVAVSAIDTLTIGLPNDITIAGALTVADVNISTDLDVSGATYLATLDTTGLATLDSLSVTNNASVGGTLDTTGAFTAASTADFNGAVTMGDLTIDATSTVDMGANVVTNIGTPLLATDAATKAYVDNVSSTGWTITDGTTPQVIQGGDTLTIAGTANEVNVAVTATDILTIGLPDNVQVAGTLGVTGATTLSSTLSAGATSVSTLDATGLASLDGGIDVDGAFTVADATGNVSTTGTLASGNATVTGTLDATGLASLDGGIDVDGAFTVADTSGNVSTNGTLAVIGTSNFTGVMTAADIDSNTLDTTGAVTIGSTLDVTGLASLDGGIDVDGAFTVADTTGDVNTTGSMTVAGATDLNGDVTIANTTWDAASTIDAGGNKIINLADPTVANDAANKNYVDQLVSAGTVWRDPIRDPNFIGVTATEPGSPILGTSWLATAASIWNGDVTVSIGDYLYWNGTTWIKIQNPVVANDRFIIAGEKGSIDSSLYNLGFRQNELVQYVSGSFDAFASYTTPHDDGYQVIDFTVAKTGGDSTGFANDATVYVLDVTTDIGSGSTLSQIQVTGSAAQTFTSLVTEINADLDTTFGAGNVVASLEPEGHIHITNVLTSNRTLIAEGTAAGTGMLATLTDFDAILAGVQDGTTVIVNDPDSPEYSHTYMYSHDVNSWTEISGPGAIDAGDNLAFSGNVLNVSPQGTGSNLDADQLDGQEGTWYQDWTNTTNKPDPTITVDGDATGSVTLTDVTSGTLTLTVVDDSHNHIIANVDGLQAALDSKLNDNGDTMAGAYTVSAGGSISWTTAPSLGDHLTNKTYVDGLIATGFDITDSTNTSTIAGGDTLTFAGTANEVDVVVSGDLLTIGLPDNVTITGALTVQSTSDFNGAVTMGDLTIDALSTIDAGANKITNVATPVSAQDAATKDYVDGIAGTGWSITDGTTTETVAGGDTLTIAGTTNEVDVAVTAVDTLTIGLPDNVSITGTLASGGAATLSSLGVTNNATVGGTLGVTGATSLSTLGTSGLATLDSLSVTNNSNLGGTLGVVGDTSLSTMNTSGLATLDSTSVTNNATVGGILTVTGTSSFTGDMSAGNIDSATLDTTGNVTVGGTLDVTSDATFESNITMNGGAAQQFIITDGAGTPTTTFSVDSVTGNVTMAGTLGVTGDVTFANLIATNIDTVTMDASGNATVGGTLDVTGASSFTGVMTAVDIDSATLDTTGNATVGGTLDVTGATTMSTLGTSGLATLESATVTNNATVGGNLGVTGESTLASATVSDLTNDRIVLAGVGGALEDDNNLTFNGTQLAVGVTNFTVQQASGNTAIGGTLNVTGQSTLSSAAVSDLTSGRVVLAGTAGELEDSANLTFDGSALTVTGTAGITSNATVGGTLGVTGATTLSSTLGVTGATTLSSTLGVTGASTLADTAVVGTLDVNGIAQLEDIQVVGSGIDAINLATEIVINEAGTDVNFRVEGDTNANLLVVDAGTDSVNVGTATTIADATLNVGATDSVMLAKGTTAERPAVGVSGMLRYNTTLENYEYFDGDTSTWKSFGVEFTVIASETFNGDDVTTGFTLASSQTTASCIVSINGVVQLPVTAYGVTGTSLVFTQAPATGDVIEVREITTTTTLVGLNNGDSTATVEALVGQAVVEVKGDLNPIADVTYDLGSPTKQWKDLHLSGTTIYLGGTLIKNDAGTIKFLESDGVTSAPIEAALDPDIDIIGGTY